MADNNSTSGIAKDELLKSLEQLFRSGEGSDLTISCGSQSWRVHTAIICPRSFSISRTCWHLNQKTMHLEVDEPNMIHKMLRYFYVLDYTASKLDWPHMQFAAELKTHSQMYILADKYGIISLQNIAADKYAKALQCFDETQYVAWEISNGPLRELVEVIASAFEVLPHDDKPPLNATLELMGHRSAVSIAQVNGDSDSSTDLKSYAKDVSMMLRRGFRTPGPKIFDEIARKVIPMQNQYLEEFMAEQLGISTSSANSMADRT